MQAVGGCSFLTVLGLIFIVLKLVGVIAWSWWWVLAPFWMPWAFFISLLVIVAIFGGYRK